MSTAATLTLPTQDGGSVEVDISATAVYTAPPPPPPPPPAPSLVIPSTAIWSAALETKGIKSQGGIWQCVHDEGTQGTSAGTGPTNSSPCGSLYHIDYTSGGGERWWAPVATDLNANHFVYDTWVWIDRPDILNCLELDVNHVDGNGNTIILGIQWVPAAGCWEYTTMPNNKATWNKSNIAAAVSDFSASTWHHVQLASHHDANGVATYDTVTIDGVTRAFQNASAPSWAALGWTPKGLININMQLDGLGAGGSINVYHSNLRIGRWQA